MEHNVLVIGCGLTGAVIARYLAEKCNKKVKILERRSHIGGNMYDYIDEHGILVQKYGPHTFHTKKKELYEFMCQYAEWEPYTLTCMAEIDGKATPTPFNFQTIDDFYNSGDAENLKAHIKKYYGKKTTATVLEALSCLDPVIREYAQFLYDKDYSLYTAKQWGISPTEIDPSIFKRVPLRFSYDIGYLGDPYEAMPKISFVEFFKNLLNHSNIDIELNAEAMNHLEINEEGTSILIDGKDCSIPVVYTGALDELFKGIDGYLPYRSLHFDMKYEDIESKQAAPVVAYPQAEGYTRITEFKKIPIQNVKGTTYAVEYPSKYNAEEKSEPYYPVLTNESQKQYELYKLRADKIENLIYCGRLADFKYYNMDQALERALDVCNRDLASKFQ